MRAWAAGKSNPSRWQATSGESIKTGCREIDTLFSFVLQYLAIRLRHRNTETQPQKAVITGMADRSRLLENEWCEGADAEHLVSDDLLVGICFCCSVQQAELLDLHLASPLASQFTLTFNSTHGQSH